MTSAKAVCEGASAIAALVAAVSWFVAASHPVGIPGPGFYAPSDPNHPLWQQLRAQGRKILRGVRWNQTAAALTGIAALFQFIAWCVGGS